jgi:plasmid maintenance system antidote protein VapI
MGGAVNEYEISMQLKEIARALRDILAEERIANDLRSRRENFEVGSSHTGDGSVHAANRLPRGTVKCPWKPCCSVDCAEFGPAQCEHRHWEPDEPVPPGETILEILEERGISKEDFAARLGKSERFVSQLINGNVLLTHETAIELERVLGVPATFWNRAEEMYRFGTYREEE